MNTIEIGAFEAKTNFSSLLREVEKGVVVHITRRGKPVAVLKKDECVSHGDAFAALSRLRKINIGHSIEEIIELRDEGRER